MHVTQDLNSFGEIITHVQLMKKMSDARKNIFCVYHIRIIAPKKNGSRHETDRFLNNHCQELEYGSTFTKLFMHVSSRNMFPTIRNLQIRVHVYRPRHCCGDWLTFRCFVPMIADHDLNIWEQIILFPRTVMQMICAWPKIWTLSGRLSLMFS
jgi:hypothetical protein